jgi:hypothetical protein
MPRLTLSTVRWLWLSLWLANTECPWSAWRPPTRSHWSRPTRPKFSRAPCTIVALNGNRPTSSLPWPAKGSLSSVKYENGRPRFQSACFCSLFLVFWSIKEMKWSVLRFYLHFFRVYSVGKIALMVIHLAENEFKWSKRHKNNEMRFLYNKKPFRMIEKF